MEALQEFVLLKSCQHSEMHLNKKKKVCPSYPFIITFRPICTISEYVYQHTRIKKKKKGETTFSSTHTCNQDNLNLKEFMLHMQFIHRNN